MSNELRRAIKPARREVRRARSRGEDPTKRIAHESNADESTDYVVGGSLVTQLALANLGCIAAHIQDINKIEAVWHRGKLVNGRVQDFTP
jgi:hypothetical protein